jgi:hypothetical protein
MSKIKQFIIKKIDNLFLTYLTVERGRGRRKLIWETKAFRDITQLYIPKFIFFGFFVFMCWKINDRVTELRSDKFSHYKSKSKRVEKIEEDNKVLVLILAYRIFPKYAK